ncbi:unnamed protein product [Sphenostylis stenocarpa]|uniref:Superoxide dismutase n=1 Tax=Sphenostylis stenocarpa TaxID=92480 RepID=A0AA86VY45_9FABA|nr:unnamed protein product [Sphenostylis stenocarpa]
MRSEARSERCLGGCSEAWVARGHNNGKGEGEGFATGKRGMDEWMRWRGRRLGLDSLWLVRRWEWRLRAKVAEMGHRRTALDVVRSGCLLQVWGDAKSEGEGMEGSKCEVEVGVAVVEGKEGRFLRASLLSHVKTTGNAGARVACGIIGLQSSV